MMPSSWLYKLRGMTRASRSQTTSDSMAKRRNQTPTAPCPPPSLPSPPNQAYSPNRTSYYFPSRDRTEKFPHHPIKHNPKLFDTHFPLDPARQPKKPTTTTKNTNPSISSTSSGFSSGDQEHDFRPTGSPCNSDIYTTDDIVFDVRSGGSCTNRFDELDVLKAMPELKLRPILTKPVKDAVSAPRSPATRIRRFKIRPNSSNPGSRRAQARRSRREAAQRAALLGSRRWLYQSLVVVKSTADPEKDFMESMAEMIVENDIRSSRDLEELLACYLSLNSSEYHRVIVRVFERIWFDLVRKRLQE